MEKSITVNPNRFNREFATLVAHDWKGQTGDKIVIVCGPQPPTNAAALFHIEKGCCDGTDPLGCYKRQREAEERERYERRKKKANPRDEFEGTD